MKEKFLDLERELIPLTSNELNQLKGGYDGGYTHEDWRNVGFNTSSGLHCWNNNCWQEVPGENLNCACWGVCWLDPNGHWPGGESENPYGTDIPPGDPNNTAWM